MSELRPFVFDEALVRVSQDGNGDPWFVAKDVCRVLEIENHRDAVSRLDDDERGVGITDTPSGRQEMLTVSESGLYALVFRSRKPEARRFRKWVTSEVLPALRRAGAYGAPLPPPSPSPDAVRGVRPSLRAKAMHAAVQAVRLTGGGEEDIQRLFVTYCGWLSAGPLPLAAETESGLTAAVERWAGEWLVPSRDRSTRSWDLYDHFRAWLRREGRGLPAPSIKAWGGEMSRRFRRIKSGSIRYHVLLREEA